MGVLKRKLALYFYIVSCAPLVAFLVFLFQNDDGMDTLWMRRAMRRGCQHWSIAAATLDTSIKRGGTEREMSDDTLKYSETIITDSGDADAVAGRVAGGRLDTLGA